MTGQRNPAPDAAAPMVNSGPSRVASVSAVDRFPKIVGYPECLEGPARAIAATKRGCKPGSPEIDRVWHTYVGQARACIIAFLEDSAQRQKAEQLLAKPTGQGSSNQIEGDG